MKSDAERIEKGPKMETKMNQKSLKIYAQIEIAKKVEKVTSGIIEAGPIFDPKHPKTASEKSRKSRNWKSVQKLCKRVEKGCKMLPKWLLKFKKIHIKIDAEKGWKKHWKNIEK